MTKKTKDYLLFLNDEERTTKTLNDTAKVVLGYFISLTHSEQYRTNGFLFHSVRQLVKELGGSNRDITKALQLLEEDGRISKTKNGKSGKASEYVVFHKKW